MEKTIRKINSEIDEDGVYDALFQMREESFPISLDPMDILMNK
ncbi:MAG: hypothetical protein ACTHJ2_09375 [Candidatus Nitrosocosmicus sp.]